MPNPIEIELTQVERKELEQMRDEHSKAYLRERAAAILKIADGHSGRETARKLLLKPHWPDTIYEWVERYRVEGIKGLEIRPGRGRKPSFFP